MVLSNYASRLSRKLKAVLSACRLAADWPETMQIVRLIAQEHMNNKFVTHSFQCQLVASFSCKCAVNDIFTWLFCRQYVGKADFLVFRTLNHHGFLVQLQEKKLVSA